MIADIFAQALINYNETNNTADIIVLLDSNCCMHAKNKRWYNRVLNILGQVPSFDPLVLWFLYEMACDQEYRVSKPTCNILIAFFFDKEIEKARMIYRDAVGLGYFNVMYKGRNTWDFHGLCGQTAILVLNQMNDMIDALGFVTVIVGVGNNSAMKGSCALKEMLIVHLKQSGRLFRIDRYNQGRIHIYL